MYPATPGITFRAAMAGWFHLGSVGPEDGLAQGRAARTRLALEVIVAIPDVRVFMRERDHPGELQATVDFLPLGRALRSTQGTFNLLASAPEQHCRVAVIDCVFEASGRAYYLLGRAELPAGTGHAGGHEGATLPATLHEGTGPHAPIVGAGVLALTPEDLARLAASMRVTGAESLGDTTLALTGFGRFFLGDLWEVSAHPPGPFRRRWNGLARGMRRIAGRR